MFYQSSIYLQHDLRDPQFCDSLEAAGREKQVIQRYDEEPGSLGHLKPQTLRQKYLA
jgi:hypothetical protein